MADALDNLRKLDCEIAEVSCRFGRSDFYEQFSHGGVVYRRSKEDLEDDAWFNEYLPDVCLYPYEYIPSGASWRLSHRLWVRPDSMLPIDSRWYDGITLPPTLHK